MQRKKKKQTKADKRSWYEKAKMEQEQKIAGAASCKVLFMIGVCLSLSASVSVCSATSHTYFMRKGVSNGRFYSMSMM